LPESSKPRVVYIGRFTSQKNIQFLIRSFSILLRKLDAELFIFGYGPEEMNLIKLIRELRIEDNVSILPSSENNYANLKTANLFPIVSIWEGMPLIMAEAMALKVPVIATDFPVGPRFLIGNNNERGLIVAASDEGLFSESMYRTLNDCDGLTARRCEMAFSFVREKIEIKSNFKNYIDAFV
jgi:glycosyltransferase involved in cell wall biosynthesis